jgi:hypothetical protein
VLVVSSLILYSGLTYKKDIWITMTVAPWLALILHKKIDS